MAKEAGNGGDGRSLGTGDNGAAEELKLVVERIQRLAEEKKGIEDDIKDVYAEAKARGFMPKAIRECIKLLKQDGNARREYESLLEAYKAALGLSFDDTPLGAAARHLSGEAEKPSLHQLAEQLREMGAEIKVEGGRMVLHMPLGEGEQEATPATKPARRGRTVRDPSDGTLATLKD